MHVTLIGTGYAGVVSAAVFASFGHDIIGLDIDQKKVEMLKHGEVPFYEPHLKELLLEQQAAGHLCFTTSYKEAIESAEIIIIAVGTPSSRDGQVDLKYVYAAVESAAPFLREQTIVAIKSTVPPGTLDEVSKIIRAKTSTPFFVASLPEFLKEGSAVQDSLHPDRVVIGADNDAVHHKLAELHKPLNAPIVHVSPASAQMAKYTANAYLAMRITFINQIADLCEKNGANIEEVVTAIGIDKRIGKHYWYPGLGYGGSCFPKDVKELAAYSRKVGLSDNLLNKIDQLNEQRIPEVLARIEKQIGSWKNKKVSILGLSFKPNTDDLREAPSIKLIPLLIERGALVSGYDPKATYPKTNGFTQKDTVAAAVRDADVIMAVIEWPEILHHHFDQTKESNKKQWFFDARNQFSAPELIKMGYHYTGIGQS